MQQQFQDAYVDVLGAHVHYIRGGAGKPLILINGLTGSTGNWRRNVDALANVASVYAIDLVNTGKSQRILGLDASLAATADRIIAFMDALGIAEADIAGHSHGGAVTLMFASRHPERVRSLILFAPANPYSHIGDYLVPIFTTHVGRLAVRFAPYLPKPIQLYALGYMYGDRSRIIDGTLDGYTVGLRLPGSISHLQEIINTWFGEMAALKVALPMVAHIPTLLVWGDRDRAVSLESATQLHNDLPESELIIVPTAGHVVFEELPEKANRIMLDWLRQDHASN